ncbi:MAG: hypothetical protein JWQ02_1531 [Capsulimonas sp.]|nr:hypothetical protein [Capsulimonas sp.]
MPLVYIKVPILRGAEVATATLGTAITETAITGSPFRARVYRVPQTNVVRDEAAPGIATDDQMRRLSIMDQKAPVRKGDIALIPSDDNPAVTERATVLRIRRYGDRVQCDLETGVNG